MGLDPPGHPTSSTAATRSWTPTATGSTTARSGCSAPTPAWATPTGTALPDLVEAARAPTRWSPRTSRTPTATASTNVARGGARTPTRCSADLAFRAERGYGYAVAPTPSPPRTAAPATTSASSNIGLVPTLRAPNPPFARHPRGHQRRLPLHAGGPGQRPARRRHRLARIEQVQSHPPDERRKPARAPSRSARTTSSSGTDRCGGVHPPAALGARAPHLPDSELDRLVEAHRISTGDSSSLRRGSALAEGPLAKESSMNVHFAHCSARR